MSQICTLENKSLGRERPGELGGHQPQELPPNVAVKNVPTNRTAVYCKRAVQRFKTRVTTLLPHYPMFSIQWIQSRSPQRNLRNNSFILHYIYTQGGSNMTGTGFFFCNHNCSSLQQLPDRTKQVLTRAGGRVKVLASLSQGRTAAAQCGLFTHKSVPVIF